MKTFKTLIAISITYIALFATGCAAPQQKTELLPLEIQAIQKREFETTKKIGFASLVSVLQDLGYIINNADFETGIITGNSPTKDNPALNFWLGVSENITTKVSAFVEDLPNGRVSIRLNFVVKTTHSSAYGQTNTSDSPITDKDVYINAFNKIEDAIFVRS